MSKIDVVRAAMVEAMKAKDKETKESLSMLLSALKNAQIDKREPLTEEEENAVVKKEIRQTKETFDTAPEDRQDIRDEAAARLAVYQQFAPEDMSEEAIEAVIEEVLAQLGIEKPSPKRQRFYHESIDAKSKGKGRWKAGKPDFGRKNGIKRAIWLAVWKNER